VTNAITEARPVIAACLPRKICVEMESAGVFTMDLSLDRWLRNGYMFDINFGFRIISYCSVLDAVIPVR
jgi:hypothetical protein